MVDHVKLLKDALQLVEREMQLVEQRLQTLRDVWLNRADSKATDNNTGRYLKGRPLMVEVK